MPLEILTGPDVPALLARAQQKIGADAVVVSVKRVRDGADLSIASRYGDNGQCCGATVTLVQTLGNISTYQAVFPVQKAPLYYRLNYSLSNWQRY